jgi:hypothetical protein
MFIYVSGASSLPPRYPDKSDFLKINYVIHRLDRGIQRNLTNLKCIS